MAIHLTQSTHVDALEAAIENIIRTAKAGQWYGNAIPDPVAAAIAHARLVRDTERCQRGLPRYDAERPRVIRRRTRPRGCADPGVDW